MDYLHDEENINLISPLHQAILDKKPHTAFLLILDNPPYLMGYTLQGKTPLDIAIELGDDFIADILAERIGNTLDADGLTMLMRFIIHREDDKAIQFIKRFPDRINHRVLGRFGTSLHMAVLFCAHDVVDALMHTPTIRSFIHIRHNGETALDCAYHDKDERMIRLLLLKT